MESKVRWIDSGGLESRVWCVYIGVGGEEDPSDLHIANAFFLPIS